MVPLASLWLPILLAAVVVFAASSVIHMLLSYHSNDFRKIPSEDAVMDALRVFDIPPGDYVIPWAGSPKAASAPEFVEKATRGPVASMTVYPNGPFKMGASLVQWFLYCALVGLFAGYVTSHAVGAGAEYLSVFRLAGATAFAGYGLALLQNSIWYKRAWGATLKSVFDALIYALLTGGVFGWLWPA